MNPDRYAVIYNSKYDNNSSLFDSSRTTDMTILSTHTSTNTKPQNQNYYYNEYCEGILEIANSLLKILLNQLVDTTQTVGKTKRLGHNTS
jgi:hypothetical protein